MRFRSKMNHIRRRVLLIDCSKSNRITNIYFFKNIVLRTSHGKIDLFYISCICECIEIDKKNIWKKWNVFIQEIGTDKSSSASDKNCFFHRESVWIFLFLQNKTTPNQSEFFLLVREKYWFEKMVWIRKITCERKKDLDEEK